METRTLIRELRGDIDRTLRPLFTGVRKFALLGYPDHANVGDSAIWLGEIAWLRSRGLRPVYTADSRCYSEERLRRCIGDGIIVFHGGGNLGDLYPSEQTFREAVISAFPKNRVIVLPQSMHFEHPESLDRARSVFDAHPDVTLVLRDRRSFECASDGFRSHTLLCPDMAFCLGPLERSIEASIAEVRLLRTDEESNGAAGREQARGALCTDWTKDDKTRLLRLQSKLRRRLLRDASPEERLRPVLSATFQPVARQRLERGIRLLSAGSYVTTDRLHGHILCLLLGIPHRLYDNSHGKIGEFYRTWTFASDLATWSE